MTTTTRSPPQQLESWVSFLRAHAAITRELSAQLQREHGLTLNDYEVLLHLSHAEGGMLRRVDLAERVVLTASGITRLLEGLERAGYVCKETCASDARVSYAKLTDAGRAKLREAAVTHLRGHRRALRRPLLGLGARRRSPSCSSRLPVTGSTRRPAQSEPTHLPAACASRRNGPVGGE